MHQVVFEMDDDNYSLDKDVKDTIRDEIIGENDSDESDKESVQIETVTEDDDNDDDKGNLKGGSNKRNAARSGKYPPGRYRDVNPTENKK